MKRKMILKLLFIFTLLLSSCNKDEEKKEEQQGCVKEENFFESRFDGETIEPHYAQGGGFGLYTLYLERCLSSDNNWLLTVTTENRLNLYLNLINLNSTGVFPIEMGNANHYALDCDEIISIYLNDEATNSNVFMSSNNGKVEIEKYDSASGIIVGTFTCEMVSTADPSIKKTITGEFNLNKSTLDNTQKPCWLE